VHALTSGRRAATGCGATAHCDKVGVKPGFLGGKLAFLVAYFETARANLRYANLAFDSNPPSRDVRRNHLPWPMANAI